MAFFRFAPSLLFLLFSISGASSEFRNTPVSGGVEDGLVQWRRSLAEAPASADLALDNSSFALAAQRTHRKDPLDGYQRYTGGWNISNQHYWASVGYTAAPLFVIAAVWFLGFGLVLFLMSCYFCCCRRRSISYSRTAYALSLILLLLFTCAAVVGCIVLYTGQGKFYGSTTTTLDYVVGQANLTVDTLKNFSDSLSAAKQIRVDQVLLPSDIPAKIDEVQTKVNSSTSELASKTSDNSRVIRRVLDKVRLNLIVISAVMLGLAFLGFLFSILGMQFLVSLLVIAGWILVAGTFILSGVFLIFHNVVGDTCVAMQQWVDNPTVHTALDDILPCVDVATANESLYRGREVTFQLVNVVNQVITNVSNVNFPPGSGPLYYNQSGPLVPTLCNPYGPDMSTRACGSGEVDFNNATQVWKGEVCQTAVVSGSEICTTVGRLTPSIYNQMAAAVNVSQGLYHYGPFLVELEDCTFVRQTFSAINSNNCPDLERYSKWVYVGLTLVSAAVMLSLVFWVIYARERRHRKYNKEFFAHSGPPPMSLRDKAP